MFECSGNHIKVNMRCFHKFHFDPDQKTTVGIELFSFRAPRLEIVSNQMKESMHLLTSFCTSMTIPCYLAQFAHGSSSFPISVFVVIIFQLTFGIVSLL